MAGPPNSKDTSKDIRVKELITDRPPKVKLEIQLQGLLLIGVQDACRDREETPRQLIKDLLEQYLKREKYLPEWYR